MLGALAAAAASLVKAARLPVLVAAQPQAWQQAQQRWLIFQSAVALAVFAAAGFLLWYGDSLLSGFAVLAALLLAAALLLPAILERVLSLGQRGARRPLAVWFWADSRQQLSGLSLALMALLLALAVNVGVGTMVESFSRTFVGWLDGRLAADVYVSAKDDAQATAIKAWLRGRPEVEAILPGGRADAQFRGAPIEILGLPDHATYSEHWPLLESTGNAWVRLRPGRCGPGQRTTGPALETRDRRPHRSARARRQLAARNRRHLCRLRQPEGPDRRQLRRADAALSRHPALRGLACGSRRRRFRRCYRHCAKNSTSDDRSLADQATMKAESKRIFNRTFAVTAALNTFTLGVAGIALLTSLLTLSNSRLPQLAPLWAIGITRRRLAAIELIKTLSVALITALLALPLGLLVAWCLIAVVNVKAFGWRLPFHVFPLQLLELLGVAMAASLLAALLPVLKLARMQPTSLIKIFADER